MILKEDLVRRVTKEAARKRIERHIWTFGQFPFQQAYNGSDLSKIMGTKESRK